MERTLEHSSFSQRLNSMLRVDFRRMFTMPFFYIMLGVAFVIPILVLVMTTTMSGEGSGGMFTSVWQSIGSAGGAAMGMDLTTMCNINMMYFLAAVLICTFVADDFRSGYCKNLFTVRAKKGDYVISKSLVSFVGGGLMLLGYFVGSMLGGAIAGLPFAMDGFNVGNVIMCMLAKIFLMAVFAAIFLLMSVIARQRLWLSVLLSLMAGMLLFTMIPMMTPLDSTVANVGLCLAGGVLFSIGLGAVGKLVLKKSDLI